MRRIALVAMGLAVLGGCGEQRSFDERYRQAQTRLDVRAAAIDQELDHAASDAAAVASEPADAPAPPPSVGRTGRQ